MVCSACGTENPGGSRFCNACGARLQHVEAREERKLVSVLFVDLVGFTSGADGSDPEDVREALQLYHAEARLHIEQYGGVVQILPFLQDRSTTGIIERIQHASANPCTR